MKHQTNTPVRSRALLVVAALLAAPAAIAQVAPAPAPLPAPAKNSPAVVPTTAAASTSDEIVEMSPFQVTADSNKGYQATRTMSGTRLNTPLEDIAASISVVTRQQIEDTASKDINDLFLYEANTEGTYQFTSFEIDSSGNQIDNTGNNPAGANRMRGLGAAQISVGGFEVNSMPIDTYNVDAVEINRGPNSSIFGVGQGSGTVNLIAGQANLARTKGRVSFQTDSYDGYRAEGDFNTVVLPNHVAVRASLMHDSEGFVRGPSYDKTDRQAIAAVVRPFSKTTIRASYERYKNRGKLPNSMTPYDYVTPWIQAGKPTWDPITATLYREDGTAIVSGVKYANVGRDLFLPGRGVNADSGFMTRITQFLDRGEMKLYMPSQLRDSKSSAPSSTGGTKDVYYISTGLVYDTPRATLWKSYGVTDKSIYDWESINIAGANYTEQTAHKGQVDIEQFIIDTPMHRLAAQASFFKEGSTKTSHAFIGSSSGVPSTVMVDINRKLIDGTPNPFYLRPFMAGSVPTTYVTPNTSKTYRAQLAYQLDLTEAKSPWLRWLGRQNFLGYGETRDRISGNLGFVDFITSVHDWLPATNADGTPRTKVTDAYRQNYRYYIGDAGQYSVSYAPQALPQAAGWHPLYWYKGTTNQWITEDVYFESLHRANRMKRDSRYTKGLVWQGSFLNDRVIPTLGFREDRTRSYDGPSRVANDGVTGYPDLDPMWQFEDDSREYLKTYRTGRTKQAGVVVKPFSWLHLHYNQSDSFVPADVAYNVLMQPLPNPQSNSKDYGVTLYLLRDRSLSLRYNQYETVEEYSRTSSGSTNASRILRTDFNIERGDSDSLPGSRDSFNLEGAAWYWVLSDERVTPAQATQMESAAQAGNTDAQAQMDGLRKKVWNYMGLDYDQYWSYIMGAPNKIVWADSSLYTARGRELEISWNPNRYFTMKGSVVNRKAFDSNTSVANSTYVDGRMPFWTSVKIPTNFNVYDDVSGTWKLAGSSGGKEAWDVHGKAGDLWWNTDYSRQADNGMSQPNITPGLWYAANVNAVHQLAIAQSGQMKPQMSKWATSFTMNYDLAGMGMQNFLRRASVGGSVRWADKQVIGYLAAPAQYDATRKMDVYSLYNVSAPVYNDPDTQVDLWTKYDFGRIFSDRVSFRVQLNVRNAFESGGLRVVKVNPDGTGANFRIVDPRKFTLTGTFEF